MKLCVLYDLIMWPIQENKTELTEVLLQQALWQLGLDQDFLLSYPLKADSKIVHLICWEWLLSTSSVLQSVLICPYFIASMLI